jgi:hypothetical protein
VGEGDEVVVLAEAVDDGEDDRLAMTLGSASMKSSPMSAQTTVGTGSGKRRPAGWRCSDL